MKTKAKQLFALLILVVSVLCITVSTNVKAAEGDLVANFIIENHDKNYNPNVGYKTGTIINSDITLVTNSNSTETMKNPTATITIPKDYVQSVRIGDSPAGMSCEIKEDTNNFYISCQMSDIVGGFAVSIPFAATTKNLTTPDGSIVHITGALSDGTTTVNATPLDTILHTNKLEFAKGTCGQTQGTCYNGHAPAEDDPTKADAQVLYGGLIDPNNPGKLTTNLDDLNNLIFYFYTPNFRDTNTLGTRSFETYTITDTLPPNTVFDANDNPGWVKVNDTTVSYTIKANDSLPSTNVTLKLKAPGATINNDTTNYTYTNTAKVTAIPTNKTSGESDYTDDDASRYNITDIASGESTFNKTGRNFTNFTGTPEQMVANYPYLISITSNPTYHQTLSDFQITENTDYLDSKMKFTGITFHKGFGNNDTNTTSILGENASLDIYINGSTTVWQNIPSPSKEITIDLPANVDQFVVKAHDNNTAVTIGTTFWMQVNTTFRNPTEIPPRPSNGQTSLLNRAFFTGKYGASEVTGGPTAANWLVFPAPRDPRINLFKAFAPTNTTDYEKNNAFLGNQIDFNISSNITGGLSGEAVNGLKIIDLLPQGLEYIPGSTHAIKADLPNAPFANIKEPMIISNYKGTGLTALEWDAPGDYILSSANSVILFNLRYSTRVTESAIDGTNANQAYLVWNNEFNKAYAGGAYEDKLDLDNDGDMSEIFLKNTRNFTYQAPARLLTTKAINGDLDDANNYLLNPSNGTANFNGTARWRLSADNSIGAANYSNLVMIDVLPHVGDTTLSPDLSGDTAQRNSNFKITLTGPVVLPADRADQFTVYYSTQDFTDMNAEEANKVTSWTTNISNWSTVTAVKIVMNSGNTIAIGESVDFYLDTKMPPRDATIVNKMTYNSFATSFVNNQTSFFESNIQGVKASEPFSSKIALTKNVDKTVAKVGDTLNYTINVKNNDTYQTGNYNLSDIIDSFSTYVPGSMSIDNTAVSDAQDTDAGWYNESGKSININIERIPVDGSKTITFQAKVAPGGAGRDIPNVATLDPKDSDSPRVDPSNKVDTLIPSVAITKAVDKTTSKVGDDLTYTLKVSNNSTFDVSNYTLKDILDNTKLTYNSNSIKIDDASKTDSLSDSDGVSVAGNTLNINFANLAATKTVTVTFTAKVAAGASGEEIHNKASMSVPTNHPAVADTNDVVTVIPEIKLEKTVDKKTAEVGDTLTYTLDLTNTGNVTPTLQGYNISDIIDTSKVSYIPNSLKIGLSTNLTTEPTLTARTDAKDTDEISMVNGTLDFNPRYLNTGYHHRVQFQVKVIAGAKGESIKNSATVTPEDTNLASVKSPDVTTLVPDITLTKTVNKTTANVGDTLTYTLNLNNNSSFDVNGYTFKDIIDSTKVSYVANSIKVGNISVTDSNTDSDGASFVGNTFSFTPPILRANVAVAITFNVKVLNSAKGETISNQATTTVPTDYPKIPDTNIVTTKVPNLEFFKTVDKNFAKVGDTLTYTLSLNNDSSFDSQAYTLSDVIDTTKVSYVVGSLKYFDNAPNASQTLIAGTDANDSDLVSMTGTTLNARTTKLTANHRLIVQFQVKVVATGLGKSIPNEAIANPDDPNLANINSNTVTTLVPDVTVTKKAATDVSNVDNTLPYTIEIKNNSEFYVNNYDVTDILDSTKLEYQANSIKINGSSATDSAADSDRGSFVDNTLTIHTQSMSPKSSILVTFNTTVLDGASGETIINTAKTTAPDNFPSIPDTTVTTDVPELELVKTVDKKIAQVGDTLTYTLSLNNTGNVDTGSFTLSDIVDVNKLNYLANSLKLVDNVNTENAAFIDVTDAKDTDNGSMDGANLNAKTNNLVAGCHMKIQFQVEVLAESKGADLPNVALATPQNVNLVAVPSNEVKTAIPDVSIVKSVNKEVARVDDKLAYTFTVTNNGVNTLSDLVLYDELSSYLAENDTQVVDIPTLTPGESAELTLVSDHAILADALGKLIDNTASVKTKDGTETTAADYTDNLNIVDSNEVITRVPHIILDKKVDKTTAEINSDLTYTIKVDNKSEFAIENYIVTDTLNLPDGITYVKNSVVVNGQATTDAVDNDNVKFTNQTINVDIASLDANKTYTITFKVHLGANSANKTLSNVAKIRGRDDKDIGETTDDSNIVKTKILSPVITTNTGRVPNTGSSDYLVGILAILLGTSGTGIYLLRKQRS